MKRYPIRNTWRYTVERLRDDRLRYRSDPERCRRFITEIRDLVDSLLYEKSDAARVRTVNKLKKRLTIGWSRIESLAVLSKIANEEDSGSE